MVVRRCHGARRCRVSRSAWTNHASDAQRFRLYVVLQTHRQIVHAVVRFAIRESKALKRIARSAAPRNLPNRRAARWKQPGRTLTLCAALAHKPISICHRPAPTVVLDSTKSGRSVATDRRSPHSLSRKHKGPRRSSGAAKFACSCPLQARRGEQSALRCRARANFGVELRPTRTLRRVSRSCRRAQSHTGKLHILPRSESGVS